MTSVMPHRPATAEVISIGDEMTSGARLDTNSQWLSVALGQLGVRVLYHTTVGDSLEACCDVFAAAANRASIVVATGGLGPTEDDLTREALAEVAGVPLEFRAEAMDHIERLFARRGRPMPDRNRAQAMFPASSRSIPNPQGTAPGIDLDLNTPTGATSRIFALPGVPAEMRQMWDETVRPRLLRHLGTSRVVRHAVIKCFGIGESDMEALLGGMIARDRLPRVGITVSRATIALRIEAWGDDGNAADALIDRTRREIYERVGQYVFAEGEAMELQHAVVEALAARGESLAVLECGCAAPVANWMAETERPDVFRGGMQFPDLHHAIAGLRSSADAVALSLRDRMRSDWCLVVDRYPTTIPAPGEILPGAEVRFHLLGPETSGVQIQMAHIGGHPEILHARIGKAGLFEMLRMLGHTAS